MGANLTLQDFFKLILFILGIGATGYLILVLSKINKILEHAKNIMDKNSEEIDMTIKELPEISKNISSITKVTNSTLEKVSPDIEALLTNSGKISGSVNSITESVDFVSSGIIDTMGFFKPDRTSFGDYILIAKEIFETLKNLIKKK